MGGRKTFFARVSLKKQLKIEANIFSKIFLEVRYGFSFYMVIFVLGFAGSRHFPEPLLLPYSI
jgi:hypothetical protein